ncbi:MAG: 2OG-Fe(II) oxygenase [Pyrinomonadaceae bacterium]
MTEYKEESPGVISIQIYQPSECKVIVEELKNLTGWTPATVRDAKDADNYEVLTRRDIRSSRTLVSRDTQKFYQEFDRRMNAALKPLVKQRWEVDLANHSGTHLLRYGPADYYVPHRDTGPGFEDRYFSVVCYLNDDFTGGQTAFPELSYSVTPESGKAIVFPSNHLHCSEPVKTGEKFVVVSWINGPKPVEWLRKRVGRAAGL